MGCKEGNSGLFVLRVSVVSILFYFSVLAIGPASAFSLYFMDSDLFVHAQSSTSLHVPLEGSVASSGSVFFWHTNLYGVPDLSFDGLVARYQRAGRFDLSVLFSCLSCSSLFSEYETRISSTLSCFHRRAFIGADVRFILTKYGDAGRRASDSACLTASIRPLRFILAGYTRGMFDNPRRLNKDCIFIVAALREVSVEYRRTGFASCGDDVVLFSYPFNSRLFLLAGYRSGNDEIITGIEAFISSFVVDVLSISHPVLGRSFLVGVGYVWMRESL